MDWLDDVKARIKRKNKILFSKDSEYLSDLALLIGEQNHRTVVLWALDLGSDAAEKLKAKYPEEKRPEEAIEAARLWAFGKIKMPEARRAILDCHALAKELSAPGDAALCHAVGQAASTVHTEKHAMGLPIYELTSIIYELGSENCRDAVERKKAEYVDKIFYWKERSESCGGWADFMLKQRR
ncbi:MAG: putative immunity protein [Oscillospiraceae bacterium]